MKWKMKWTQFIITDAFFLLRFVSWIGRLVFGAQYISQNFPKALIRTAINNTMSEQDNCRENSKERRNSQKFFELLMTNCKTTPPRDILSIIWQKHMYFITSDHNALAWLLFYKWLNTHSAYIYAYVHYRHKVCKQVEFS